MNLTKALGRIPTKDDLATHFADSISAMEQNRRIARECGEMDVFLQTGGKISSLKKEARRLGLAEEEFPGLYK